MTCDRSTALRSTAIGAGLTCALIAATRRLCTNWGATKQEAGAVLPGDDLVPGPAHNATRAVTVHAPPSAVWRWLVQIGQDRGGMYSYDWLENLVGLRIHSTQWIRPEWQLLSPGDLVRLVPRGWLGLRDGYALIVHEVIPEQALVLHDPAWPSVWSFHLHPLTASTCRLIARGRGPRARGAGRMFDLVMAPIEFAMTRRMLRGIKERAESDAQIHLPDEAIKEFIP